MKIQIKITKEVLRRSMWCGVTEGLRSENCAIAVAVRDIFPDARVRENHIWTHRTYIDLPDVAVKFIRYFDMLVNVPEKRMQFPEFSFEIEVPDEVIERIGIQQAKDILERSETLNLIEG